jgi:hypothetical protein
MTVACPSHHSFDSTRACCRGIAAVATLYTSCMLCTRAHVSASRASCCLLQLDLPDRLLQPPGAAASPSPPSPWRRSRGHLLLLFRRCAPIESSCVFHAPVSFRRLGSAAQLLAFAAFGFLGAASCRPSRSLSPSLLLGCCWVEGVSLASSRQVSVEHSPSK